MRRVLILLLMLLLPCWALCEALPVYPHTFSGEIVARCDTPTLQISVEEFEYQRVRCYVSKIWMAEPGRQIRKATAPWEESLMLPADMAKSIPGAALVINGSGYVSPVFPWIPENYPGVSEDYHYTPLGSLTVTDGEVFRNLPGVPFYGLTLEQDGLHMHTGADNKDVLAGNPLQTWSFYVECPIILDHKSILDPEWRFSSSPAIRTIIAKMDANNYITLTVTSSYRLGLTMTQAVALLQEYFDPQWAYNLDGGPSSALLVRQGDGSLRTLWGGKTKDTDIMAFVE